MNKKPILTIPKVIAWEMTIKDLCLKSGIYNQFNVKIPPGKYKFRK